MGSRGPIPKRSEDRRRGDRKIEGLTRAVGAAVVPVPEADPAWDPIARELWESACSSGQARFYEPSDYAMLYSLMDDLTYYKAQPRRSSEMLSAIMSGLTSLLLTEGDRRRARIELTRPDPDVQSAGVVEMEKWRARLVPESS